mmetsp:Transcript_95270/g.269598  ORF Transcript_95270/g.269598 Transcript_95270/m.269598 type:complete len:214 (+) Transcript_95270:268-909(+)
MRMPPCSGMSCRPAPSCGCTTRLCAMSRGRPLGACSGEGSSSTLGSGDSGWDGCARGACAIGAVPRVHSTSPLSSDLAASTWSASAMSPTLAMTSPYLTVAKHLNFVIQMLRSRRSCSTCFLVGFTGSCNRSSAVSWGTMGLPRLLPAATTQGWVRHLARASLSLGLTLMRARMRSLPPLLTSRPGIWETKGRWAFLIWISMLSSTPSKGYVP